MAMERSRLAVSYAPTARAKGGGGAPALSAANPFGAAPAPVVGAGAAPAPAPSASQRATGGRGSGGAAAPPVPSVAYHHPLLAAPRPPPTRRGQPAFQPSYETFGPMRNTDSRQVKYKPPASRELSRENLASQKGSVVNLHCDDTLRRVSVVLHRHVLVCERRKLLYEDGARAAAGTGPAGADAEGAEERAPRGRAGSRSSRGSLLDDLRASDSATLSPGGQSAGSRSSQPRPRSSGGRSGQSRGTAGFHSSGNTAGGSCSSSLGTGNCEADGGAADPGGAGGYRGALGFDAALFDNASELLDEDLYLKSQWKYAFIHLPRLPLWTPYRMERVIRAPEVPTVERIYSFIRHLFVEAELSSECCVVCLVYVERLMERASVELLAINWRPIVMAGMLLASKVWQDLSSWNIEFARVYPQFSVQSINRLERNVLRLLQWDLFISGAVYAKYYFALRSLNESKNFRQRYNYIMRPQNAPQAKQLEKRSAQASNLLYSRSL